MDKLFYDLFGMGYVVNLERAVERRKRTSLNLNEHNIPFLCVSAIEGSTVTVPEDFRGSSDWLVPTVKCSRMQPKAEHRCPPWRCRF